MVTNVVAAGRNWFPCQAIVEAVKRERASQAISDGVLLNPGGPSHQVLFRVWTYLQL